MIAPSSQQPKHECVIVFTALVKTNGKKWPVPTQGGDCDRGVVGVWGWWRTEDGVEGCWACGVNSRSGSGVHLCVIWAELGLASLLSKYLHANWCYLIHLSVKRFHNFKNWRGGGPLMALSWQFDSDFIIRAWCYNKQELSCPIRHARWRSPSPPDSLHPSALLQLLTLCELPHRPDSLSVSHCACLGREQEGSCPTHWYNCDQVEQPSHNKKSLPHSNY